MRRFVSGLVGLAMSIAVVTAAQAQGTIKIGLILPYSGQFADTATQMDNGIKLYMKKHGETVAGKKIEIIRKDVGGPAPDVAKRLAQELVVRDSVDILAGFVLTPNALAASDVSAQAKKFMVIMNAATSIITTKSRLLVRTSVTLPQVTESFGAWAFRTGIRKTYTMVSDYGPGHDAEGAFQRAFKGAGGEIIGSVRFPVANPDFSAFVQRAKDLEPGVDLHLRARRRPAGRARQDARRARHRPEADQGPGHGRAHRRRRAASNMGDAALDIITAWHYDHNHDSALNKEFVREFAADNKINPNFFAVGGYDGMHLIYEALKKTGGKTDGDSLIGAAKGMQWESPRGPVSIDPETRDIIQTIYIRRVQKVGGNLVNVEFDKIEKVKDPVKASMKK